jgi:hypothetical protein
MDSAVNSNGPIESVGLQIALPMFSLTFHEG